MKESKTKIAQKNKEKLFEAVCNKATAGIALLNNKGYYEYANLAFREMVGYTEKELKNMTFEDITYQDDIELSIDICQAIWDGKFIQGNCQKRYICKNGRILWTEINLSVIKGKDDGISNVILVIHDISDRKRMETELFQLAMTDYLTGINNRRSFMKQAQDEFNRAQRYQRPFALLLLDVDRFKCVNDIFGHLTGDRVLIDLVKAFKSALRETDIMARIGGEEFAILLLESDERSALNVARRIQRKVKKIIIESAGQKYHVTVSIGIAIRNDRDRSLDLLFKRADDALYRAKDSGRDRIVIDG